MKTLGFFAASAALALSACVTPTAGVDADPNFRSIANVPDAVMSAAGPSRTASDIRIDKRDNCFVYRYDGPVEVTYLPLTNAKGQPMCIKAEEEAAEPTS